MVEQVIRDFETRKKRIAQLDREVSDLGEKIRGHRSETEVVRRRWLDPLKDLIGQISSNFSAYFTAMKCAGEVSLSIPQNPVCIITSIM